MYPFLVAIIDKITPNPWYIRIPALENNNGLAGIQNSKPKKSVIKPINVSHIIWSIKYLIYFLINLTNIPAEWTPLQKINRDIACPLSRVHKQSSWWRHQMETFSALLAICAGNSPVPGEFPAQRPVTQSFDVFFDLRLNKRMKKQSLGWWFETLSCPLCRRCNVCAKWRLWIVTIKPAVSTHHIQNINVWYICVIVYLKLSFEIRHGT